MQQSETQKPWQVHVHDRRLGDYRNVADEIRSLGFMLPNGRVTDATLRWTCMDRIRVSATAYSNEDDAHVIVWVPYDAYPDGVDEQLISVVRKRFDQMVANTRRSLSG